MITDRLAELVLRAIEEAIADGALPGDTVTDVAFERPRNRAHGDWATNVALMAARGRGNPRAAAQAIVDRLPTSDLIERVEVAGPGFLNFHLAPKWLQDVVRRAADPDARYGWTTEPAGVRFNVEYVSANPTGPINVVSGRHAAVGDAIANLLEATGHEVTREFYVNDAGRQVMLFARSLEARYLQHFGRAAEVPEEGYQGAYVTRLAEEIAKEHGDAFLEVGEEERVAEMRRIGLDRMRGSMRSSLERFGTRFDVWFSESDLHAKGAVDAAVHRVGEKGLTEERDGAVWFLSSRLGDDKDRVLIRSNGEPTYLASDLAYLMDKFGRGFDRLLYLWGADHHGTIPRLVAGADALGFPRENVEVDLVQIVTLFSAGEAVKASKRAGILVPLDDLVAEVGTDAARYTFLNRSIDSPLEFDVALAKQQAPENPVYYVQYAHARICSILRKARTEGHTVDPASEDLSMLGEHPSEDTLLRKLASFEEVVPDAAQLRSPQRITRYVEELASVFSAFYRDCRVVSSDERLTRARLVLCAATKAVIASGLNLLGVTAPERM